MGQDPLDRAVGRGKARGAGLGGGAQSTATCRHGGGVFFFFEPGTVVGRAARVASRRGERGGGRRVDLAPATGRVG
jgi:hypothetical protein